MPGLEFDLNKVYREAFGYEAPQNKFVIGGASSRLENSQLGQPYYLMDAQGREFFMPVTVNGIVIPFGVLSMNWRTTFVSTPLPERGGSVKELVSIDDYVFNLKGIFVNDENYYPEQDIIDLHKIFMKGAGVSLRSVLSDIVLKGEFEHKCIIKEIRFPSIEANEHTQPFEISLESDMIFTLEI